MEFMRGLWFAAAVVCAANLCAVTGANAGIASQTYDAGLGTLPADQGFTHVNIPDPGPALTVNGGLLRQDTRGYRQTPFGAGYQYFIGAQAPDDLTNGLNITLEMQVIESSYDPDFLASGGVDSRSAGYGVAAVDGLGRFFALGISDTGVYLENLTAGDESQGSPFFAFDTTDAMHTYDIMVSLLGIVVTIDDNPAVSLPLGPSGEFPGGFELVAFGDIFDDRASLPTESVTDVAEFSYRIVPEPHSGLILLASIALTGLRRFRNETR